MPWPIHRSAEDLDTEPSQPLRFPVYVFDQEADLAARRVAAFATDEPRQLRPFEKRELGVLHLEFDVAVTLDPHLEPDHVAVKRHRPRKRFDVVDYVVHAHEYTLRQRLVFEHGYLLCVCNLIGQSGSRGASRDTGLQ